MKKKPNIFKLLLQLSYWIIVGISMRIENWSKRNKKVSRTLSYIFFPIAILLELIGFKINQDICLRDIDNGKKNGNEHLIYSMCYHYLKFLSRIHKWKRFISKKWYLSIIERHKLKLYNYSIVDKTKTDYTTFKNHLGIYGEGYMFFGGGILNKTGDTIIEVQ